MNKQESRSQGKPPAVMALPVVRSNVAGIDIGSREHWVAAPPQEGRSNVRVFVTTTAGLNGMADWLVEQGVESVAMESTSVYWIPVYELLESRGLEVLLVNARQLHNVPGRKTDTTVSGSRSCTAAACSAVRSGHPKRSSVCVRSTDS